MYSRKKPLEEVPQENTAIWMCSEEGCNGWIRDNFSFECVPTCWQCNSPMVRGERMLATLVNANKRSV